MSLNRRWLLQAIAFVGCIFAFLQIWEISQQMIAGSRSSGIGLIATYALLFLFCFLLMAITSYLKQKANGTLQNKINWFEKLIVRFHLLALIPHHSEGQE